MQKSLNRSETSLAVDLIIAHASRQENGSFVVHMLSIDPRVFPSAQSQRSFLEQTKRTAPKYCLPGEVITAKLGVQAALQKLLRDVCTSSVKGNLPVPQLLHVFDRSPKVAFGSQRFPSIVYLAALGPSQKDFAPGVVETPWQDAFELDLLFDHRQLLTECKRAITKSFLDNADLIHALMGKSLFSLGALQRVFQLVTGKEYHRSNFPATATGRLKARKVIDGSGRHKNGKVGSRESVKLYQF